MSAFKILVKRCFLTEKQKYSNQKLSEKSFESFYFLFFEKMTSSNHTVTKTSKRPSLKIEEEFHAEKVAEYRKKAKRTCSLSSNSKIAQDFKYAIGLYPINFYQFHKS